MTQLQGRCMLIVMDDQLTVLCAMPNPLRRYGGHTCEQTHMRGTCGFAAVASRAFGN